MPTNAYRATVNTIDSLNHMLGIDTADFTSSDPAVSPRYDPLVRMVLDQCMDSGQMLHDVSRKTLLAFLDSSRFVPILAAVQCRCRATNVVSVLILLAVLLMTLLSGYIFHKSLITARNQHLKLLQLFGSIPKHGICRKNIANSCLQLAVNLLETLMMKSIRCLKKKVHHFTVPPFHWTLYKHPMRLSGDTSCG